MRRLGILVMLAALALASGCGLVASATRNLVNEPCLALEERQHRRKAHSLAREAWARAGRADASHDFRDGYLDGYADYLEAGRTTDPPTTPPKRYQKVTYETPTSLRAVDDYFAGFHAGAEDARGSGQRQRMVVPVALPVCAEPGACGSALPAAVEQTGAKAPAP